MQYLEVQKIMEAIFEQLCSKTKLDRDRGLVQLAAALKDVQDVTAFEQQLEQSLPGDGEPWSHRHAALVTRTTVLQAAGLAEKLSPDFVIRCRDKALISLDDPEYRVRMAAGELMGALCAKVGASVYEECRERIMEGVRCNLERQPLTEASAEEQEQREKLMSKLSASPTAPAGGRLRHDSTSSTDSAQIFHDTAGWKNLETWMSCLRCMIKSCGSHFYPYIDQELLDLIFTALDHTNRFVRETGYTVCGSIVGCGLVSQENSGEEADGALQLYGVQFAEYLRAGLSDNWSQVRLASSMATREFLMALPSDAARSRFFSILIPPMCLNRYYVAEGVRTVSQQTWKMVVGNNGKHVVQSCIEHVVAFYIEQSEADNHAVREAACSCIAELASKIEADAVRPYVHRLLDALLVCFKDDSWPVRDMACVSCGNFIVCFPEECRPKMDELYPLFYDNLQDTISSVRQGAAQALANVVRAYGESSSTGIVERMRAGLQDVEHQAENTEKYAGLETGPATYSVVKRLRDNDADVHTNQQMYSCGSLAPKMHRGGKRGGGCMDHQFRSPPEKWTLADGCIMLLSELCQIESQHASCTSSLPLLVTAITHQHYTQHVQLCETFCKQLPNIAKGLGKRQFKMYIETFFEGIFYSLCCDNALTSTAAAACLQQLSQFIGPNILKGRIENYNPRYMELMETRIPPGF